MPLQIAGAYVNIKLSNDKVENILGKKKESSGLLLCWLNSMNLTQKSSSWKNQSMKFKYVIN